MPSFTNTIPGFVKRKPGTTLAATIVLGAATVAFLIRGSTGGLVTACTDTGCVISNLNVLGSITQDGVSGSSGATLVKCSNINQSQTIRNTAAETTFNVNCVIPANTINAGDAFRITAMGTGSLTSSAVDFSLMANSTNIAFRGQNSLGNFAKQYFGVDATLHFLTVGASARTMTTGWIADDYVMNGGAINSAASGAILDTTSDITLQIAEKMVVADPTHYLTLTDFVVEKLPR